MKPGSMLGDAYNVARHAGDRYRQLVERLPAAICTCELDGRVSFFNEAAAQLWGREPAIGVDLWCGSWRMYLPDGAPLPADRSPMAVALREGRAIQGEDIIIERPDGTRRHVRSHVEPIRGDDGVVGCAVNMLFDVTDALRAQQAFQESEQRFRTVAMNAPAAIYVKDRAGRYTLANALACQALGRPDGVTGLADRDLLSTEAAAVLERHDAEVMESGVVVEYEENVERDGFFAHYLSVKFPLFDARGAAIGVCGVSIDITARKRAENARRESDERFARFMQHLPGLAWIKDAAGKYVFANDAAAMAFQVSASELIGKSDVDIFPADTAAQFIENDCRAFGGASGIQTIETLKHPDNEIHYSLVSKFPIPGADGAPALIGGMAIDVTSSKRAEEALREADQRKDEFLAILAHELRNPLAPIRTGLELMRIAGDDAALIEEVRDTMDRQTQQMVRLIDDLLDVSRITRGTMELRKSRVELATVVRQAVEAARPIVEEQGHYLTLDLPDQPLLLDADPTRLAQVISNLLNNAAKYMPAGGEVRLKAERNASSAILRVSDSGIGIPDEMLDRIFDMFTQVDRSLERSHGGLGIGLTLVKRLVEMHGGTVYAESAGPGLGSEFVVTLPLSNAARLDSPSTDGRQAEAAGVRRILVVDDNESAARVLSLLLKAYGHDVRTAHDGLAAVETAAEFLPDVVLMDIGMPKLNGNDAARRIRQQPWGRHMVLAALTGLGQDDDKARTRDAGFDHHFVKPLDVELLRQLLAEYPARRP